VSRAPPLIFTAFFRKWLTTSDHSDRTSRCMSRNPPSAACGGGHGQGLVLSARRVPSPTKSAPRLRGTVGRGSAACRRRIPWEASDGQRYDSTAILPLGKPRDICRRDAAPQAAEPGNDRGAPHRVSPAYGDYAFWGAVQRPPACRYTVPNGPIVPPQLLECARHRSAA